MHVLFAVIMERNDTSALKDQANRGFQMKKDEPL